MSPGRTGLQACHPVPQRSGPVAAGSRRGNRNRQPERRWGEGGHAGADVILFGYIFIFYVPMNGTHAVYYFFIIACRRQALHA